LTETILNLENLPPTTKITGKCKAIIDNSYDITVANEEHFKVDINFICNLNAANTTGFVPFSVLLNNDIEVQLLTRSL
jgi:hypothetical protein